MDNASLKIRQVFLPYLLIVNGVILGFLAIGWQLNQKAASSQSVIWTFFIPGIATLILMWRFLQPRLLMLEENVSRNTGEMDQGYLSFYFLTLTLVLFMTWRIDEYVSRRLGRVAVLENIAEVSTGPPARYYFLKQVYVNKKLAVYDSVVVQPKGGNPSSHLRIGLPFLDNHADTLKEVYAVWLAYELSKEFRRSTDKEEWDSTVFRLNQAMRAELKAARLDSLLEFQYLERAGDSDKDLSYRRAIQRSQLLTSIDPPVLLYPVSKPFTQRNRGALWLMLGIYLVGSTLFLSELLFTDLKEQAG